MAVITEGKAIATMAKTMIGQVIRDFLPKADLLTLEELAALLLGHAAPDPVGLGDRESVLTAMRNHRALVAHFFCATLSLSSCPAALAIGMKEHRGVDAAT